MIKKKIKVGIICFGLILVLLVLGIVFKDKLEYYWYRIYYTRFPCRGEAFYEEQALSYYDYKVHHDYVAVSGYICDVPGSLCPQEKTIELAVGQKFYLPSGLEQSVRVRLEKIENNKAYFLFSYGAAPPACETVGGCDYSCEFVKE